MSFLLWILVSGASCLLGLSCPFAAAYNFLVPIPLAYIGVGLRDIGERSRLASKPSKDFGVQLEAGMSEGWRRDLQLTS